MSKKTSKFMGILLTLIMLGSAISAFAQITGATTNSRASETETNDDANHANAITSGVDMTGSIKIAPTSDLQDWYSFSCTRGQAINVSLFLIDYSVADPGKYNLDIVLFRISDDGTALNALWVSILQTRYETASGLCIYTGTYFVWVAVNLSDNNHNTLGTHYTLDVTTYSPTALSGGQSDSRVLSVDSPNWFHWYKITTTANQVFTVKTTPPAQGQVDMDMYAIWNRGFDASAGNQSLQPWFLNQTRTSAVGAVGQMNGLTGDMDIYVQEWLRKGTGLTATKFEVINSQEASDNNNVPADAVELKKTSSVLTHVQQSTDTMDWYKFTIDTGFHANITMSPQNGQTSYWNMTIWDSSLNYVEGYFNTKDHNPFIPSTQGPPVDPGNPVMGPITLTNWQPPAAGTYYISVMGISADPQNHFGAPPLMDQDYRLYIELPDFGPSIKTPIPDATINEDEKYTGLNVADYFSDKEGDPLTYAARIDDSKHVTLKLTGSNLSATPAANWNGECNITVDATDGMANIGANTVHQTFMLTVLPVNDLPFLAETLTNFTMTEGEQNRQTYPYKLNVVFGDIDSTLSYSWSGNSKITVRMDAKTTNVYFSAPDLWYGEENITFTAKDEGTSPAKDLVDVKVVHRNHEPQFTGSDGQYTINMKENEPADTSLNAKDMFMDIDTTYAGDHLVYRIMDPPPLHLNVTILPDYTISVLPDGYWSGDETFKVSATDDLGAENQTTVTVNVAHVNQAPHIMHYTPFPGNRTLVIKEGQTQAFVITSVSDIDNDTKYDIRYSWYVNDDLQSGDNVKNQQFTLRTVYQPANGFAAGDYHIKCVISDGLLNDQQEWNITVTDVNQAPTGARIIAPLANVLYVQGTPITFSADKNATDPDGDPVTYRWYVDATNYTLSSTNAFTLDWKDKEATKELNPGIHKIDMTISDGRGGTQTTSVMVSIKAKNKAHTPGFEAPGLVVVLLVVVVALGKRRFKHL